MSAANESLIEKINRSIAKNEPYFSFEFFPPKTEEGVVNLYDRVERMRELGPMWVDITWGAGGSSSEKTLDICQNLIQRGFDVMMHLTCTNVSLEKIIEALDQAKKIGVKSILALRGDPPMGELFDGPVAFYHAVDLVKFIRQKYQDTFTIAVAAYPEGHYSSKSFDEDIQHLKEKVDNGADLIVTQLCYDVGMFEMFIRECKEAGIKCPIVAGLMPIYSFERFERITHLTQVLVPEDLIRRLYPIKTNEEAVKELGVQYLSEMIEQILSSKYCLGFHFYTLNLEKSVSKILHQAKLVRQPRKKVKKEKIILPQYYIRGPKSEWDDFPNERWGDERSPAFGNLINEVWYSSLENTEINKELLEQSLRIKSESDVFSIFVSYCQGKLSSLPWFPESLALESSKILFELIDINQKGYLTINSQPSVNGASSNDKTFGWGDDNGYVYQKAYLEFFCSPENWERLKLILDQKHHSSITYLASSIDGELVSKPTLQRNALTWGIFPGKEVVQTTLISSESFDIWKKEAFSIWQKSWISLLPPQVCPDAIQIIKGMAKSYYLVNLVENNYMTGDLFRIFKEVQA